MKSAIVLASTAALVGALPQGKPAAGQKLPWIEDVSFGGLYCGWLRDTWFEHSEENCGTQTFCEDFDDQQKMRDYLKAEPEFKSAKECFAARETKPGSTPDPAQQPKTETVAASQEGSPS
ncbi:hypothetical protein HRG_008137 [Hirsutella rhossiliensis]|uniref:Uncharacterized protein n=1 Tax=Hirsutella rhossiliensis TaxID=111463 RepID=A0A9P8MTP8_9HYPO|nr:uncharacterized protein HRG_08137 [Hirsutella rhossiliensis]KAH0960984.1 hypothetical protein HRG_08137 [Hirsutella rhossiliensis]